MGRVDELYLIHHCHTDVGYTHGQPVFWDLQRRFIDTAIDLAETYPGDEDDRATFRWTVETTAPLLRWLETAPADRVDRFLDLEDRGQIEVTAMPLNTTPLYGRAEFVESLRPVAYLREEYGIDVSYAMNCDVNGQNWPVVDALLDAGVEGFSMAINEHYGGTPLRRPYLFDWEGPSGRSIPVLNGLHYSTGYELGIGHDVETFVEWWPRLEDHLAAVGWDERVLPVQVYHPFGDNAPGYPELAPFVAAWNERTDVADGDLPALRIATPSAFWDAVDTGDLPTHRGDWTDFWNFGSASTAREVATNRESRARLRTADALEAGLSALGDPKDERDPTRRSDRGARDEAWEAVRQFDEHTWGMDLSVSEPDSEDARSGWHGKARYAYEAKAESQLLRRDGVAELARHVAHDGGDDR
jgi:hypothetical protein